MISNDLIKYRDRNGNVKEVYSENNPPPLYEHNIHIEIDGLSTDSPKTYVNFTYIDKSQGKVFELDILIYRMGDGYRPATGVLGDLSTYCSVISVLANNGSGLLTIQAIVVQRNYCYRDLMYLVQMIS